MKYEIGQIVAHRLTGEKFLILALMPGKKYKCTNSEHHNYIFEEIELEQ